MFQNTEKPNVLTFKLVSQAYRQLGQPPLPEHLATHHLPIKKNTLPPQTKNENIKMYDNFTAQNHTTYCSNKMLYFGGIQGKM